MSNALTHFKGAGLAAPQIGVPQQVLIFFDEEGPVALINPRIVESSDEQIEDWEGCLSFPGVTIKVKRAKAVRVAFQDVEGKEHEQEYIDFQARVIQHEIEHLEGKVFTRYLSKLKRDVVERKMKKVKRRVESFQKSQRQ